jgi:hypothetical protein
MYVGKTEYNNPSQRWKEHLHDYHRRKCEKRPLYSAMNKHGIEHFHFEIIEETDNTVEREQYWINKLRTYVGFKDCNGYNATLGGDGKSYLNLNETEVIKYHTEEVCYVAGQTAKHFNVDVGTIINILKKNKITYINRRDIPSMKAYQENGGIIQVDKQTRMILNIFENNSKANHYLGKNKEDNSIAQACSCIRRNTHYAYGYLWYYGKDLRQAIDNGEIKDIII